MHRVLSCLQAGPRFSRRVQRKRQPRLQLKSLLFVRFAKHIGCVSLPRDETSVFVSAFSEYPVLSSICNTSVNWGAGLTSLLAYKDVLISEFRRMGLIKLPVELRIVKFLPAPTFERNFHGIAFWSGSVFDLILFILVDLILWDPLQMSEYKDVQFLPQFILQSSNQT